MSTLTNITGHLYDPLGNVVEQGILKINLQQDMISVDATKVAPYEITIDLSETAGYVDIDVYATDGALPAGISYKVEFDPDPDDTSKPLKSKDGYWRNYWAVPNIGSVSLGSFAPTLRGAPAYTSGSGSSTVSLSTTEDSVFLGAAASTSNKRIRAHQVGKSPEIRYNETTDEWEFSNDGTTFASLDQGGGGTMGGDISGAMGSATVTKIQGQPMDTTDPTTVGQVWRWDGSKFVPSLDGSAFTGLTWAQVSKTGSSLADLATKSAGDLTSGTLAAARLPVAGITSAARGGVYVDNSTITVDVSGMIASTNGLFRRTEVTLTNAQIKALPTTPITIVAAQGAGKRIVCFHMDVYLNALAGVYTNIDENGYFVALLGTDEVSSYIVNDPTEELTQLTGFLTGEVCTTLIPWMASSPGWGPLPSLGAPGGRTNGALKVSIENNGTGNLTGGNAANTMKVRAYYYVETD